MNSERYTMMMHTTYRTAACKCRSHTILASIQPRLLGVFVSCDSYKPERRWGSNGHGKRKIKIEGEDGEQAVTPGGVKDTGKESPRQTKLQCRTHDGDSSEPASDSVSENEAGCSKSADNYKDGTRDQSTEAQTTEGGASEEISSARQTTKISSYGMTAGGVLGCKRSLTFALMRLPALSTRCRPSRIVEKFVNPGSVRFNQRRKVYT